MSVIDKAIVISDMHLGKPDSYLFSESPNYSSNRQAVKELLLEIGPCDELILNGDILDLAMAGLDTAYQELKLFFKLLSEIHPIKRIIFLPGNHDHHFWRSLVEQIEVDGRIRKGKLPPGFGTYTRKFVDRHYSSENPDHEPYILFPHLWPKEEENKNKINMPEFVVKYPHHLLKISKKENHTFKSHYHLITHGHFLEELFKPINYLIEPNGMAQLEAFNNLWLESFNYYLGHADELSKQVRVLEQQFLEGGKEAKEKVKAIFDAAYLNLKKSVGLKCPWTLVVKFILKRFIRLIPEEKMGRSKLRGADVTKELLDDVKDYIEKYIIKGYVMDSSHEEPDIEITHKNNIPTPFTFVFGHTHVPFQASIRIAGETYPVVNSGGWIRSDGDGSGKGKYAGMVVIENTGARWASLSGCLV